MRRFIFGLVLGLVLGAAIASDAQRNVTTGRDHSPAAATTGAIAPGALLAGGCGTGTVTVTGAATGDRVLAVAVTYPGDGVWYHARVTSANTVTVYVCAAIALTPTSSTYTVTVFK